MSIYVVTLSSSETLRATIIESDHYPSSPDDIAEIKKKFQDEFREDVIILNWKKLSDV